MTQEWLRRGVATEHGDSTEMKFPVLSPSSDGRW